MEAAIPEAANLKNLRRSQIQAATQILLVPPKFVLNFLRFKPALK